MGGKRIHFDVHFSEFHTHHTVLNSLDEEFIGGTTATLQSKYGS